MKSSSALPGFAHGVPASRQIGPLAQPPSSQALGAPPVYRPGGQISQLKPGASARPSAPPVYRPQTMVSQARPASLQVGSVRPSLSPSTAKTNFSASSPMAPPPVYRPQQSISQMKTGPASNQLAAPPVYRASHFQTGKNLALSVQLKTLRPSVVAVPRIPQPRLPSVPIQRFVRSSTIQRIKIYYRQADINTLKKEKDGAKKSFRTAMEDLHGNNIRSFTAVGRQTKGRFTSWQKDIAGSGGGGRGDYRLHVKLAPDGFIIGLYEHSGTSKHGGVHVPVNKGACALTADSSALADEVSPAPPPLAPTPPAPSTGSAPSGSTSSSAAGGSGAPTEEYKEKPTAEEVFTADDFM
jgi:hypothetical protein